MVVWQGITEGGTAVPVQVTEDGRVVAEGQAGPAGPPGPEGPQGPAGTPGKYGPGDDVEFGNITATGNVQVGDLNAARITSAGDVFLTLAGTAHRKINFMDGSKETAWLKYRGDTQQLVIGNTTDALTIDTAGGISAASNKCGFTSEGELIFSSRGTRYKMFVQNGTCFAEEYSRATELREKAENLRQPKTQDIVPED